MTSLRICIIFLEVIGELQRDRASEVVLLLSKSVYEYTSYLFAVGGPAKKAGLKKNNVLISAHEPASILHYSH